MRGLLVFLLSYGLLLSQGLAVDTTVIAVFGDSLTAGYGIAAEDAFPAQLERRLVQDGYAVKVINDGVSGDTSAGAVSRIDGVLQQQPTIVILEFGGNDLMRGIPPANMQNNLKTVMDKFYQARIAMVVAGEKAPPTLGAQNAEAYNAVFSNLAQAYSAPLYPFFLEGAFNHPNLMLPDGIHPNKDGVAVVVNNIYPVITALLKK